MNVGNQNPNTGGSGSSNAISEIVPDKVDVTSPDNQSLNPKQGGPTFEPGSPAGREAKPKPHHDGFKSVIYGS